MASTSKNPNIALELLTRTQGAKRAESYFKEKIIKRPLYLKPAEPVEEDLAANARDARQRAQRLKKEKQRKSPGKPRPLSAKQKRALQIYNIPKEQQKYEIYVPLWRLWCGYMREVLGLDRANNSYGKFIDPRNSGPLLCSADYHGALLEVVRSRCVSRVGVKGIVVRDTKFTFELVTQRNELKGEY